MNPSILRKCKTFTSKHEILFKGRVLTNSSYLFRWLFWEEHAYVLALLLNKKRRISHRKEYHHPKFIEPPGFAGASIFFFPSPRLLISFSS